MKGKFIAIEGTDGSGKSTQTEFLVERLKKTGKRVERIDFPRYGEKSAALIEDYLNGKFGSAKEVGPYRASVFYALDRYAANFKIKNWLAEGKIVIANRYMASNMGHQGGKIHNARQRKKFFAWIYNLEYNIFKIPKPNVNIILHVPAKISQKLVDKKGTREYLRGKKRDIHEDDLKHLKDAGKAYLQIAKNYPEFKLIKCVQNNKILLPEIIHQRIWKTIQNLKFKI